MNTIHARLASLAATISMVGVAIHVAAIVGGPSWYAFFGAPPAIVDSARTGTWLAPVAAAAIALLMGICFLYACSALGVVKRLPWLRTVLAGIAAVCLFRALLLVPLAFIQPALVNVFEVVAALAWGLAGAGFVAGFLMTRRRPAMLRT